MIIHHAEPCISCKHYSPDPREDNHWVCDFDHDTCPHIEALHKAVGYKERIDAEVLDKIKAEIEQIQGNEYEVSDMQGNRYKYETIEKAEALQIIDTVQRQARQGQKGRIRNDAV